jgi:hypothetical protein
MDDGGSSPASAGNFTLHHRFQTGSGAHPASYSVSIRDSLPGSKAMGVKLTTHLHLVPRSRMHGNILPFPQYAFTAWCSVKKHKDNFTFYLYVYAIIKYTVSLHIFLFHDIQPLSFNAV